ncbi:hypothetical protein [Rhodoferax sp. WC2427]|uniref:hypothetical protein n=1 Tax=Rhodoferax sp. WC2427 TaxID=3234144 RepID=UPI00346631CE
MAALNFAASGNQLGDFYCDLTGAAWTIGFWTKHSGNAAAGGGIAFQTQSTYPASLSATMAANDQLSVYDTGNSITTVNDRRRLWLNGTDKAGNRIGSSVGSAPAPMYTSYGKRQYETGDTGTVLNIVRCVSGVVELWIVKPGQSPEKMGNSVNAWTGFAAIQIGQFGLSSYGGTLPYAHSVDAPFHFSDKAVTVTEMAQIAAGASPNSLDKTTRAARGMIRFRTASSTSVQDTMAIWVPTAGTTVTFNGTTVTFVASGATGSQVNIGADGPATMTALAAFLNASADANISVATYVATGSSALRIFHKTTGSVGEAYTLAASSSNVRLPLSGTLAYVEWEYNTLSSTTLNRAQYGGGYIARTAFSWAASPGVLVDSTEKPNAVYVDPIPPGRVVQHIGGVRDVPVSGVYLGSAPSGVLVELRNASNDAVVVAEAAVASFTASAGTWSGVLTNVPKGKRWLSLRMRKVGGTDYLQTGVTFGVGEYVEFAGQSLFLGWPVAPSALAPNTYVSNYLSATNLYDDTTAYSFGTFAPDASWHRQLTTAEARDTETYFGNYLSETADCVVGIYNRCRGGTSIDVLNADAEWSKRAADLAASKALSVGWFIWAQGHADTAFTSTYGPKLDAVPVKMHANYGANCVLVIPPTSNVMESVDGTAGIWAMRKLQVEWLRANAADPYIISGGQFTDFDLTNDGVHPATPALKRYEADRLLRALLFKIGVGSTISADGPLPVSAVRTGAVIDVTFALEGGFALQTVGGAAPSGFDVSTNGFTSILAISSTAITGSNTVRITLAADPGVDCDVLYLYGRPGKRGSVDTTGRAAQTQLFADAQASVLYDTSPSLLGLPKSGKPAQGTYTALSTGAAQFTILRTTSLLALMCR